jgi:hypothetical protein
MSNQEGDVLETHDIGPHRMEIERPDVVHIHYMGQVTLDHFKLFDELIQRLPSEIRIYLLRDARQGGIATPEARAHMVRAGHLPRLTAVVTYGAAFQARTLVKLTNTAVRTLTRQTPDLAFVDTEGDARAWIAEHRKRVREVKASPPQS